jgi:hypothetical protein
MASSSRPQGSQDQGLVAVACPAAIAGECRQAILLAAIAPDAGETAGQVPALEELLDHLWDDGTQEGITRSAGSVGHERDEIAIRAIAWGQVVQQGSDAHAVWTERSWTR